MIKYTYLYRELMLRIKARRITHEFYLLREKGMLDWEVYGKHRESIRKSFDSLRSALTRYKERRIKAGYFYMCKHRSLHMVFVMSPLYTMPRKEARKKIKKILQRREAVGPNRNKTTIHTHVSSLAVYFGSVSESIFTKVWLLYLFLVVISCIIVLVYDWCVIYECCFGL
ncbi:hypothetical protein HU200_058018 [Digitaria exilis]|uniref:Uncharacterized protein n=1 Tax=Digitaria exilis TaxID=1010633 RepID=A0A835AP94_9POAL|nr:hypothetical protein HU200_058018 [Digitaria exilis]